MIGKRVSLRAIEPSDIDLMYDLENDTSWWHLSNTVAPFSRFVLEQYFKHAHLDIYSAKQLRLMITANVGKKVETVGMIDLFEFDPVNMRAGIGILVDKKWQNKGYASEALVLLIEYGFNTLNLHQLYCSIGVYNDPSLKLFQKHGFKITGQKEQWTKKHGTWADEYFLQLINPKD